MSTLKRILSYIIPTNGWSPKPNKQFDIELLLRTSWLDKNHKLRFVITEIHHTEKIERVILRHLSDVQAEKQKYGVPDVNQ